MSGNSGTGGNSYGEELRRMREMLDTVPVVGFPKAQAELLQLESLIERYPIEAKQILAKRGY